MVRISIRGSGQGLWLASGSGVMAAVRVREWCSSNSYIQQPGDQHPSTDAVVHS